MNGISIITNNLQYIYNIVFKKILNEQNDYVKKKAINQKQIYDSDIIDLLFEPFYNMCDNELILFKKNICYLKYRCEDIHCDKYHYEGHADVHFDIEIEKESNTNK